MALRRASRGRRGRSGGRSGSTRPCRWRRSRSRSAAASVTFKRISEGDVMPENHFGGEDRGALRHVLRGHVRSGRRRSSRRLPGRAGKRRRRARARDRHGPDRAAALAARRARPRNRPVGGHGREAAGEARSGGDRCRRSATSRRRRVDGTFSLAYLVFNTINNLTTQDEQVACFQNVAEHLEPGGCFVIEVGVPGLRTLPPGKRLQVFAFGADHIGIDEYDPANQGLSRTTSFSPATGGSCVDPVPLRVAGRARPDGATRRDDSARALERLEARAVHEREHEARLGLGEARLAGRR